MEGGAIEELGLCNFVLFNKQAGDDKSGNVCNHQAQKIIEHINRAAHDGNG